jgi:hypothetical protein
MKKIIALLLIATMCFSLAACNSKTPDETTNPTTTRPSSTTNDNPADPAVHKTGTCNVAGTVIEFSENDVTVNSEPVSQDATNAVYASYDVEANAAMRHTIINITQAGDYILSGYNGCAQIAVNLGENAAINPNAVVNLYLNGVKLNYETAPAIIFYNVYECIPADKTEANIDTAMAGANVFICEDSVNILNGALYSCMSMNINGSGILTVNAKNKGIDSAMHLTINDGTIYVNTENVEVDDNEDNMSVTTINGGELYITATGVAGDGDDINSNDRLVINGGVIRATGNGFNITPKGEQTFIVFRFQEKQRDGSYALMLEDDTVFTYDITNDFTYMIVSSPDVCPEEYSLWCGETRCQVAVADITQMQNSANITTPKVDISEEPDNGDFVPSPGRNPNDVQWMHTFVVEGGANYFIVKTAE